MPKFKVLVLAQNLHVPVAGQPEPITGFLVWRYVEADSEEAAIELAFDSVRRDPKLESVVWTGDDPSDLPRLSVDDIHEVPDFGQLHPPGSGYIFL